MAPKDASVSAPAYIPAVGPTELHKADENKRRRGPVSCAECRRLKLKCDRRVPCSSCSKRGCAAICPNGTLSAGPGNRFVLADTQHLHEKIQAMGKRIEQLEDALALLQAQISTERHPLLSDDLMLVKAPMSTQNVETAINDVNDTIAESLGTLTLGERVHFFGSYAAADYLLLEEHFQDTPASGCSLPLDLMLVASNFPMTNLRDTKDAVFYKLIEWLPSDTDASRLVDTYYTNAAWIFSLIKRDELNETILKRIYPTPGGPPTLLDVKPHDMAVLFMIFAIGCIADLNRQPYNVESSNYYQLARVSLGIDSVVDHPTLQAVRAVQMMSTFMQMVDHPNSAATCYMLLGISAQMCRTLGLHRDDTQWNLSDAERQQRRHVFWEVVSFDTWSGLAMGRPPAFTSTQVDALLADDTEKFQSEDGEWQTSFRTWNHKFTRECMLKIMDQAFGVTPLTYATVLRLDRMVREHPMGESLRLTNVGHVDAGVATGLLMQRNVTFSLVQKLLLYMHRSFFAHALMEHPEDPLKSKYAQSVLATFRCAFYITASARALYAAIPLALRWWMFWSHMFSASVILGSIVIKSPGCSLAPAAWVELDRVYELFEQITPRSRRIERLMPNIRKLRAKAHAAYTAFTSTSGTGPRRVPAPEEDMELRFLWGRSRLVDNASSSSSGASPESGSSASPQVHVSDSDPFARLIPPPTWSPLPQYAIPPAATQPQQQHQPQPQQWSSYDAFAANPLPLPMSFSFGDNNMGDASGVSMLAAAASMVQPMWAPQPPPNIGDTTLSDPGSVWQRFIDGMGLPFEADTGHRTGYTPPST
ncbi:hypothetical protein EXIGLDRAFT_649809 [Exidia glandulosa HHB12029]|uniref:Zn(2)-C6 fungal-type domain-containing protein n=1 Tax=Exidia glandulosa HHB12029 TaxID=1314781 RepID=A0A165G3H3_EXIGL|nr:hypothetical protein EXIGLDRAFT_649809 [Exidia glandulosa HHB12029]